MMAPSPIAQPLYVTEFNEAYNCAVSVLAGRGEALAQISDERDDEMDDDFNSAEELDSDGAGTGSDSDYC